MMKRAERRVRPGRHGFTLIELLITITVIMIVLGFAVGPLQTLVARHRLASAVNGFVAAVSTARVAAALGRSEVTLCADDHGSCGSAADWARGALLFLDADADHTLADTEVLKQRLESNPNVTILADLGYLTFNRDGTARMDGATALRWVFCDPAGRVDPRLVTVLGTGNTHLYQPGGCSL